MPRKKSNRWNVQLVATYCHQRTPERNLVSIAKSRLKAAMKHASKNQELSIDHDGAQTNGSCRVFKDRARLINKNSHSSHSISRVTSFESYFSHLYGKKASKYKAYIKYKKCLKATVLRIKESSDRKTQLCLEKSAAIQTSESDEEKPVRLCHEPVHVRKVCLQPKLQKDVEEAITNNGTQIKSIPTGQGNESHLQLCEYQVNVKNGFRPRFRGGMCPKISGNYNLMMEED